MRVRAKRRSYHIRRAVGWDRCLAHAHTLPPNPMCDPQLSYVLRLAASFLGSLTITRWHGILGSIGLNRVAASTRSLCPNKCSDIHDGLTESRSWPELSLLICNGTHPHELQPITTAMVFSTDFKLFHPPPPDIRGMLTMIR